MPVRGDASLTGKGLLVITTKVIAACFALAGFAATAIAGVFVGNSATLTLVRALLVMFGAWAVGLVVGTVMQKTIQRHVDQYKENHPLPDAEAAGMDAGGKPQPSTDDPTSPAAAAG